MASDQIFILTILAATMGLFIWGRWRHDVIALASLLTCVALGLVPSTDAFAGFAHPAVITIACVLVLSGALQATGAVDVLARHVLPARSGHVVTIGALSGLAAVLSGFMNNVGALALLMPLALQTARRLDLPPGQVLMPLAFSSILGGMTTLIGTPPNMIVSGFRNQNGLSGFSMFDFTPVGLAVAVAGIAFIVAIGWRLVPKRERRGAEGFETGAYLTEARVPENSKAVGMLLRDVEAALGETECQVVGLIRDERPIPAPNPFREVRAGDILIIESDPDALSEALGKLGLELEEVERGARDDGGPKRTKRASDEQLIQSDDIILVELAVRPRAEIIGRSVADIGLRARYGVNLLALSREGRRSTSRLRSTPIRNGDVLLVQGTIESINEFSNRFGCIPLAERNVRIPEPRKALIATAIMGAAIAAAAFGLAPTAAAFSAGFLALPLANVVPARRLYDAIDWPVIVLVAALIPVAGAMSTTGAADLIATRLTSVAGGGNAIIALLVVLIVTMVLSDFMNNAATAAVMCPIATGIAARLSVNPDAFLMAVAVGASCAFLTPIGHQNNMLILGPGGFRFGDYWKLGLPLEVVITMAALPMILWIWPL